MRITKRILRKQSQLLKGEIGAKSYMKGDYEEFHALRRRKNKANQSQFPTQRCGLHGLYRINRNFPGENGGRLFRFGREAFQAYNGSFS